MEKYFLVVYPPAGEGPPRTYELYGQFSSRGEAIAGAKQQYPEECEESSHCDGWEVFTGSDLFRVQSEF